jgi:hypothetical protein
MTVLYGNTAHSTQLADRNDNDTAAAPFLRRRRMVELHGRTGSSRARTEPAVSLLHAMEHSLSAFEQREMVLKWLKTRDPADSPASSESLLRRMA